MVRNMNSLSKQNGVVAIMVGICMVMFMLLLAMVIDLGHLYVARAGLQNAADAAALSGAKELDETSTGITSARDEAIETAGLNTFLGSMTAGGTTWEPVVLTEDMLRFSDDPYAPDANWLTYAEALAAPEGLGFIKVDTGPQGLTAFFEFWVRNISTYGRAVAGHFVTNITPIGICGFENDPNDEFGFRRGVNYSFAEVNAALGGLSAGTELYLHPTASSPEDCESSAGNASYSGPYLCKGESTISGMSGGMVYANTGLAACKTLGAINTRFDQYPACMDAELTPDVCTPDVNIKQYVPQRIPPATVATVPWMTTASTPSPRPDLEQTVLAGPPTPPNPNRDAIANWLADESQPPVIAPLEPNLFNLSDPNSLINTRENANPPGCKEQGGAGASNCSDNYGVLWSYTRPARDAECPNCPVTSTPSQWSNLYPSGPSAAGIYTNPGLTCANPDEPGAPLSPYCYGNETGNSAYFQAPANPSEPGRRLLNVVIVNCGAVGGGGGICQSLPVLGVGQFFLQNEAGGPRWINGEFVKRVSPGRLDRTIKLYQ